MSELHTAIGECVDSVARQILAGKTRVEIRSYIDEYWEIVTEGDPDDDDVEAQREICYELMDWWLDNPLVEQEDTC